MNNIFDMYNMGGLFLSIYYNDKHLVSKKKIYANLLIHCPVMDISFVLVVDMVTGKSKSQSKPS